MVPCHCLAIRQAARQVTQLYDQHLASTGLRATQYAMLRMLAYRQPATMQEFALAIVMDRTTLTRSLRPLEREGLVVVEKGRDARTRILRLTQAGWDRLAQARAPWDAAQADFEIRYGSEQVGGLRDHLAHLVVRMGPALAGPDANAHP